MKEETIQERILLDRYHLVELIGTGAMGQVYRAEDKLLGGVTVAVKFLSQTLLNEKMRKRFRREVQVSALLAEKNIHIIKVRDCGEDENDVPFYVMEFLQGQSLSELIKLQPLPLQRFLSITRQICLGMDSAHIGIDLKGERCQVVHRDIKPSNIYIIQDRSLGEFVKILDFGIAKVIQADVTQTSSFMGTLAYCSPEQMEGKELDNRSDIYSLGVMMYEMLSLQMPILPESSSFGSWYKAHRQSKPRPFESHLEIPQSLKKIIMQCMAKSPLDRPQSVGEVLKVIQDLEIYNPVSGQKNTNYHEPETLIASSHTGTGTNPSDSSLNLSLGEQNKDTLQWPSDKPIKKIVFPRILNKMSGGFTGLWVMLDKQDILNRKSSTRYNYFLFLSIPHPMILWITVIYNREFSARWLPCYLDLKTNVGQKVASTLAEEGNYRIFFFSLEEPKHCEQIMVSSIDPEQCRIMKEWIELSHNTPDLKQSLLSKERLKDEFQKLKPKILQKLKRKHK